MNLGDRIKKYESVSHHTAMIKVPLMVRVDGRAFHTFTKNFKKPFDNNLMYCMVAAAKAVASDMSGFKVGYVQSDEATFCLTDYDNFETQGWFDYDLSKVISTSAALMSVNFLKLIGTEKCPTFDSRAFSIPEHDVINAFLWRAKDWERNSLQMYARSFFSHKELHGKKRQDIHEMLHKIGKNWCEDLTAQQKNGTYLIKTDSGIVETCDILPTYTSIEKSIGLFFNYNLKGNFID